MDDLISDFLAETSEGLIQLDNDLVELEKDPDNQSLLGNIFRVMHTIKGTCGFLGMARLEKVAHAGENVLGKIRDREMQASPDAISLILQAIDSIKNIVEHIEEQGSEPGGDDSAVINALNDLVEKSTNPQNADTSSDTSVDTNVEAEENIDIESVDDNAEDSIDAAIVKEVSVSEIVEDNVPEKAEATPAVKPKAVENATEDKAATTGKAASQQSLRVGLDVLENLMQQVGELVLTRNQLLQMIRKNEESEFVTPLHSLNKITTELQEGVMKTRMQPIGSAWAQFPRLVRDLSIDLNKKIELKMIGEETELDRQLLSTIKDPLTHMVRNSGDHGLEDPEDRLANGKSEIGTITLQAAHEGGHIIISVSDDGRGLDPEKIRNKIIEKELADEDQLRALSDKQVYQYIFEAGFSTADKITSVSGRGVGMDVVRSNIESIGGTIELESEPGKGSTFLIKIPLTLAIMPVLIVKAEEQRFAFPQINIVEIVKSGERSGHLIEIINEAPVLRLRENLLPLVFLRNLMGMDSSEYDIDKMNGTNGAFIVVCKIGGYSFGVIVDMVYDTEEIVVKPVTPMLKNIEIYSGCTILGDGSVIMIVDVNGIFKTISSDSIKANSSDTQASIVENKLSLLKFEAGSKAPKVVPLELVSRLEEMKSKDIEVSGGQHVVQYRGQLMKIINFDEKEIDQERDDYEVIVFEEGNNIMGLLVDKILDIVSTTSISSENNAKNGFLQSVVINEQTCDLIDISYFFKRLFPTYQQKPEELPSTGPKILLVDDSPFFRKFIPPSLSREGFVVDSAINGKDAIDKMESGNKPDVIVTDINMPIMGGTELVNYCKQSPELKTIPIIALSSHASEEVLSEQNMKILDKLHGYVTKTNHEALVDMIKSSFVPS